MPRNRRRRQQTEGHEGRIRVRTVIRISGEEDQEEEDRQERWVEKFETEPAYVRVSAGVTKQLRQYESLRVDVSVSVPCYKEVIEEAFDEVSDWVADALDGEVDKYLGGDPDDEEDPPWDEEEDEDAETAPRGRPRRARGNSGRN